MLLRPSSLTLPHGLARVVLAEALYRARCVRCSRRTKRCASVASFVTFAKITRRQIDTYIGIGEPFSQAGAYGIQGFGGTMINHLSACVAQRLPACAQLRVSASELQKPDRALAGAAEVRSRSGVGLDQATRADSVYLLRGGDEDRAHPHCSVVCRGSADPACGSGGQLIMRAKRHRWFAGLQRSSAEGEARQSLA